MTSLQQLFSRLPGLKSSDDFAGVLADLEQSLATFDQARSELSTKLETAMFDSPERAEAIRGEIAENANARDTIVAAINGAKKRRDAAIEADRQADLDRVVEQGEGIRKKLHAEYLRLHSALTGATGSIRAIRTMELELQQTRVALRAGGRSPDLRSPFDLLMELVGHRGHSNPTTSSLVDYLEPHRHPSGPMLARMKEIKL